MLVVFDVDGTLCETHEVDARCFARAVYNVTGIPLETVDWAVYPEVTSSGIVRDFLVNHSIPDLDEMERKVICEFVALLEAEALLNLKLFNPVDGALEMFRALQRHDVHKIAIATGCWSQSAKVKLRLAGFDVTGVPFASSTDSPRRREIIALAADRAAMTVNEVIYVGDGSWDFRATRELGIPFIGMGSKHQILRNLGAPTVFASYLNSEAFLSAIKR